MKKKISLFLIAVFLFTALAGCGNQNVAHPSPAPSGEMDATKPPQTASPQPGDEWEDLFTYDVANAAQLYVKAAIPNEEEAYEYPWGGYDDLPTSPEESEESTDSGANKSPTAEEIDEKRRQALERLTPEQRKIAEEAMQNAEASQGEEQLPNDWDTESNQPTLGGRMEFISGDDGVIIEMSEYCVDTDTVFTVTPIKQSMLPPEFLKGGFSLVGDDSSHVTLNDYAIITFLTNDDPGEDVVIKSFSEKGGMEYSAAEVMKLGDAYMITGAVEHFSTVGYGVASLPALAPQVSKESTENLRKFAEEQIEKMRREKANKDAKKKVVRTIEFDEIIFTKSAAGKPLQLHLRAKLVESPKAMGEGVVSLTEKTFVGKIWVKFYTWMPEGYGVFYMLCNQAELQDPCSEVVVSLTNPEEVLFTAAFNMTNTGGSTAVAYGVGSSDASGKTYTNVQTSWKVNTHNGNVQVTFTNMQGAAEKTFITGKLRAKTERQASKNLKWFLD